MRFPSLQQYKAKLVSFAVAQPLFSRLVRVLLRIRSTSDSIYPIFTLRHFCQIVGADFKFLRLVIGRKFPYTYTTFYLKKNSPSRGFREINVPCNELRLVQRWLVENIISHVHPSEHSFAFHPGSSPYAAAAEHRNTKWLLKVDIKDFFHSVSEHEVYDIFYGIGFQKLLAFELARICTIPSTDSASLVSKERKIEDYQSNRIGRLPQGAPSSPMLANLAMRKVDHEIASCCAEYDLRFTRYADDIAISSDDDCGLDTLIQIRRQVFRILRAHGFDPNPRKSVIRKPGDRKIVLGLLVDTERPRLTSEFKNNLRMHLYYLMKPSGPSAHAKARNSSITTVHAHVLGLIHWARYVDSTYGNARLAEFKSVNWPKGTW